MEQRDRAPANNHYSGNPTSLPIAEPSAARIPERDIKKIRLNKEIGVLEHRKQYENKKNLSYDHYPEKQYLVINKIVKISYGPNFPFEKPQISFLLKKDPKYKTHLCMFDLQKLEFRDIMKEDYHPSINFAEIAERSQNFLAKNVILEDQIPSGVVGTILKKLHGIENEIEGYHWFIILVVALLNLLLIIFTSVNGDPQSEIMAKKMSDFNIMFGKKLSAMDPLAGNLLIFYLYQGFSAFFGTIQHFQSPQLNRMFVDMPPYAPNCFIYAFCFKSVALFLQIIFVYIPTCFLVESCYKKNSKVFKALLTLVCLTAGGLYTQVGTSLDFQGILYLGFTLWCNAFLLSDNVVCALLMYGFSLNCSLDGLIYGPYIFYKVCCKVLKNIHKSEGIFESGTNLMYQQNNLDIGLLNALLSNLHSCGLAIVFGSLAPWIPYFLQQDNYGALSNFNLFYDPFKTENIYNNGVFSETNRHSIWATLGFSQEQVKTIDVPLFLYYSWIIFSNSLVIAFSRTNKNLGSHKKHLLQVLLITHINYLFGNPKPQSQYGVLQLIILLQIILYSEFSIYALVFSISAHSSDHVHYISHNTQGVFFLLYFVHFYGATFLYRNFVNKCLNQMVNKSSAIVDVEETSNPNVKKTMKNEAFRVQNALVKQMTLRGKYGISKFMVNYHDYVYIFYLFDVPVISGLLMFGYFSEWILNVHQTQIFPKMVIMMVMAVESLLSHYLGPGLTPKRKEAQEALKGPFKGCQCNHEHHHHHGQAAPVDATMGLVNKVKES